MQLNSKIMPLFISRWRLQSKSNYQTRAFGYNSSFSNDFLIDISNFHFSEIIIKFLVIFHTFHKHITCKYLQCLYGTCDNECSIMICENTLRSLSLRYVIYKARKIYRKSYGLNNITQANFIRIPI